MITQYNNISTKLLSEISELLSLYREPKVFEVKLSQELKEKKDFIENDGFYIYEMLSDNKCPSCDVDICWDTDLFSPEYYSFCFCPSCDEEFEFNELEALYIELSKDCTESNSCASHAISGDL